MHATNLAADAALDKPVAVLDKGFVRLVDYMGGDARIVQAARVSYGEGTKTVREDQGLINYLMKNRHTSPFEQVELVMHIKMPIFVARQHMRHRTASVNEISGRYSEMRDEFYVPNLERIQKQAKDNKQGSGEAFSADIAMGVVDELSEAQHYAYKDYQHYLELGLAKELARINLPNSLYTEFYWKQDLHNMFHFLGLRLDGHAQFEIREYAKVMASMCALVAPLAYAAFEEHVLNSRTFTAKQIAALNEWINHEACTLSGNELNELREKLGRQRYNR